MKIISTVNADARVAELAFAVNAFVKVPIFTPLDYERMSGIDKHA